jgi:hypothetical protein
MPRKKKTGDADRPKEVSLDEMIEEARKHHRPTTDAAPSMRDGDSGEGSLHYDADAQITTDNDVGDVEDTGEPLSGPAGGAIGGTPARGRAEDRVRHGISSPGGKRGDSTIGADPDRA